MMRGHPFGGTMRKLLLASLLVAAPLPAAADPLTQILRGIRVTIAPPAVRYEVPPPAPSPRYQWIAGYWSWSNGRHDWIQGHWAVPPHYGYAWEPARWEQ